MKYLMLALMFGCSQPAPKPEKTEKKEEKLDIGELNKSCALWCISRGHDFGLISKIEGDQVECSCYDRKPTMELPQAFRLLKI